MNISLVSMAEFTTWAQTNLMVLLVFALIFLTVFALIVRAFSQRKKRENFRQSCTHTEKGEPPFLLSKTGEAEEESKDIQTAEKLKNKALGSVPDVKKEPKSSEQRFSLNERLSLTRETVFGRIGSLLGSKKIDTTILQDLESLLFSADLGVRTAESLLLAVKERANNGGLEEVRAVLKEELTRRLRTVEAPSLVGSSVGKPYVILVLGVNGSGKTTTIGKLAFRFAKTGKKVLLGAADTFRAAAVEQLETWGKRSNCEVISGPDSGDPAAVAFDTVKTAKEKGFDVAIIDTAGRLQTKEPLMEQLGKIYRILGRDLKGAPHETLLVLDANTGQNAINQTRLFSEVAPVTGLALTKLDGSAKGGILVGLADEFHIPVRLIGVGEKIEDLRDFDSAEFVEALFGESS